MNLRDHQLKIITYIYTHIYVIIHEPHANNEHKIDNRYKNKEKSKHIKESDYIKKRREQENKKGTDKITKAIRK